MASTAAHVAQMVSKAARFLAWMALTRDKMALKRLTGQDGIDYPSRTVHHLTWMAWMRLLT
jgi:hypothetical protein